MAEIIVFGDSIAWGAWDLEKGGWVERLKRDIDGYQCGRSDFWCPVYNLGISGDTASGVAGRIAAEIAARHEPHEELLVVAAVGINDSILHLSDSSLNITVLEYRRALEEILAAAVAADGQLLLVGLCPLQEEKLNPLPWDAAKAYTLERAAEFNAALTAFARHAGCPLAALWDEWCSGDFESLLRDGLHPNELGHHRIYLKVKEELIKLPILRGVL